jgi:rhamnosyltransferase
MKASVIIPTKNGGERYGRVLHALFENTLGGGFEVIVIDSGSRDRTIAVSRQFPVRFYEIRPEEFSHGGVRNYGSRLAKGEFLVFLSQDAIPASPDWLEALIRPFSDDPLIAGVYSRQVPDGTNPMETFFLLRTYGEQRRVQTLPRHAGPAAPSLRQIFFSNVASAVRRSAWEQFPFREDIIMSEDNEWSKRVLLAGYAVVYEPAAKVYHSHDYTFRGIFRRNYDSGRSLVGVVREPFMASIASVLSFLKDEFVYLMRTSGLRKIPDMVVYECVRHAGFLAGTVAGLFHLMRREHHG